MTEIDFEVISSGESPDPKFDVDTQKMIEPDGSKRDPDAHETVRAATMAQKAARDPMEEYKQLAEKNGTSLPKILRVVKEFDDTTDPVQRIQLINKAHGVNDQAVAQELYLRSTGQSVSGQQAHLTQMQGIIDQFYTKHPDKLTRSLEPKVLEILRKEDPRLRGAQSYADRLDIAFGIAWHDSNPTTRVAAKMQERFRSKDEATEAVRKAKRIDKYLG